jgi:hypothetical protein
MLRNYFETKGNLCASKPSTRITNSKVNFWNRTDKAPEWIANKPVIWINYSERKLKTATRVISLSLKFRAWIIEIRVITCEGSIEVSWK